MTDITSFKDLHNLPDGSVVQDAKGQVWCVQHHGEEIWLNHFSDEYSFTHRRPDGVSYALGDTPTLPIKDLGIISTSGG